MRKIGSDPDIKATASPLPDQQSTVVTKPEVQASQHSSSFPVTLDSTHIHLQGDPSAHTTLPLHCPPPPPPPQPPSYAQSLAKSHYCHSETLSEPPAYSSANVVVQSSRSLWTSIFSGSNTISGVQPTQGFRRIPSSTSSLSSSGAASSIPSTTFTYDQKLSRPISSGQGECTVPQNIFAGQANATVCSDSVSFQQKRSVKINKILFSFLFIIWG